MENKIVEIYHKLKHNIIDKDVAIDQIISIIDHIQNHKERYEAIKSLASLDIKHDEIFPLLESLLLSDSNEKIRVQAAKIIKKKFLHLAYKPMKWALTHESSPAVLALIHESLMIILKNQKFDKSFNVRKFLIREIDDIENKEIRVSFEILKDKKGIDNFSTQDLINILLNYYTLVYLEKAYWRIHYSLENFKIIKLDFIFKGLTKFPEAIKYLNSLKSLIFRYNQISELPEWIGDLESLEVLNFNVNELSSLPNSIGNLGNLEELYLWKNNLKKLPSSIGSLKSLKKLNLRLNYISYLPISIGNMSSLKELNLHDNKLQYLPDSIGQLKSIQKLNLSWNLLEQIPTTIGNLDSLKSLDLGKNELETIPDTIGNLTTLKNLNLSENRLKQLPNSIVNLQNLEYLNLTRNNLISLPKNLDSLPNLKELYVGENHIDSFSAKIKNLELIGVKIFF